MFKTIMCNCSAGPVMFSKNWVLTRSSCTSSVVPSNYIFREKMRKCHVVIYCRIGYSIRSLSPASSAAKYTNSSNTAKPISLWRDVLYPSHPRHMKVSLLDHMSVVRCVSSSTKQSLSFERNSLLRAYLDKLVDCYDKMQQEQMMEADVSSNNVGATYPQSNVSAEADFKRLTDKLANVDAVLSSILQYRKYANEMEQLKDIVKESADKDKEIAEMATEEIAQLQQRLLSMEDEIIGLLIPPVFGDHNDVILEVTAGVGGQEAMLFAKELFDMYVKYANYRGWSVDSIDCDESDIGGYRHAMASISGNDVFMLMKFEGGVHRVQRVPRTEKSGRVHTSTVTVAVMPQPSEVDIVLNPKDLRIETCRASGKGGQHVNTTDSAVRIVHIPTGTFAECQAERSQIRNKMQAMKILQTRLYENEMEKNLKEQWMSRKLQVGSAARSEKIRTYNMKDDRITDHRLDVNLYGIESVFEGGKNFDELVDMLQLEARYERLLSLVQNSLCQAAGSGTEQ